MPALRQTYGLLLQKAVFDAFPSGQPRHECRRLALPVIYNDNYEFDVYITADSNRGFAACSGRPRGGRLLLLNG